VEVFRQPRPRGRTPPLLLARTTSACAESGSCPPYALSLSGAEVARVPHEHALPLEEYHRAGHQITNPRVVA
jgi:hypothetical protein